MQVPSTQPAVVADRPVGEHVRTLVGDREVEHPEHVPELVREVVELPAEAVVVLLVQVREADREVGALVADGVARVHRLEGVVGGVGDVLVDRVARGRLVGAARRAQVEPLPHARRELRVHLLHEPEIAEAVEQPHVDVGQPEHGTGSRPGSGS